MRIEKVFRPMQPPPPSVRLIGVKLYRRPTMTNEDFAARIMQLQGTLYRVTCTLLREHADREDAVQSAIEKA